MSRQRPDPPLDCWHEGPCGNRPLGTPVPRRPVLNRAVVVKAFREGESITDLAVRYRRQVAEIEAVLREAL